jgi:nitrogen-specific signal transduction histidine kinase
MSFFEEWVELDLNPILSFSSSAKILYSNSEAQFLLNRIKQKELFDLALTYAPKTFGALTSYIDLTIKNYTFYAITVTYQNEDEIHMKLYKSAMVKKESKLNIKNINTTNIFTLVDLAISTSKIKNNINFAKNYDPSIPEFKLDASTFIKTLNTIFETFKDKENVSCSILLKIGEYIKIDNKKYSLISVEIGTNEKSDFSSLNIKENNSFILTHDETKVTIDLPLIL